MGTKRDLTGLMFGDCLVLEEIPKPNNVNGHKWNTKWKCKCGCGEIMIKTSSRITKSENPMCRKCASKLSHESKNIDLTGKVFGELTVIKRTDAPENVKDKKSYYWECMCSCGKITVVKTSNLNSGHCTRCWECAHYKSNSYKRIDLTGKKFGYLTVLEMIYPDRSISKTTKCRCICECGKEIIRSTDSLSRSEHANCGCKNYEILLNACAKDINGKKFGRLTVLDTIYDFENHTTPKVRCKCDCGNIVILNKNNVQSMGTLSCGCLQRETASLNNVKDWTGFISDSGVKMLKQSYMSDKNVWMWDCECPICGKIFQAIPARVKSGHTTSCGCRIKSSLERITESILIDNNINYIKQYSFDDCKNKYKLKFDFAVLKENGDVNFLIENDGRQHYESVDYFGGENGFRDVQKRDKIKNDYCILNNIPLLRLPYYLSKEEIENEIKKAI